MSESPASIFRGKRVLSVINSSSYQLFVLECIFSHEEFKTFEVCDLLIPSQMPNANTLAAQAEESGLFGRVLQLDMPYDTSSHLLRDYLLKSRFGENGLRKSFYESVRMGPNEYNLFLYPSYTPHVLDAKAYLAQSATCVVYEEGSGTYDGLTFTTSLCADRVVEQGMSEKISKLSGWKDEVSRLAIGRRGRLDPAAILVFRPDMVVTWLKRSQLIMRIPYPDRDASHGPLLPLDVDLDLISNARMIFLTLSDDSSAEMLRWEREILQFITEEMRDGVLIKLHPGRSDVESFSKMGCGFLPRDLPWETFIASVTLPDDCFIAGIFSSGQITPHVAFGLEPKVLFCFGLTGMSEEKKRVAYETVRNLEDSYTDADRICVPEEWEELQGHLK